MQATKLLRRIAGQGLMCRVEVGHNSIEVDDDNGFGGFFEQQPIPRFALPQRFLGPLALDDVCCLAGQQVEQAQRSLVGPARRPVMRREHPQEIASTADQGRGLHCAHAGSALDVQGRSANEDWTLLHVFDHDLFASRQRRAAGALAYTDRVPELEPPGRKAAVSHDEQVPRPGVEHLNIAEVRVGDCDSHVHNFDQYPLPVVLSHKQRGELLQPNRCILIARQLLLGPLALGDVNHRRNVMRLAFQFYRLRGKQDGDDPAGFRTCLEFEILQPARSGLRLNQFFALFRRPHLQCCGCMPDHFLAAEFEQAAKRLVGINERAIGDARDCHARGTMIERIGEAFFRQAQPFLSLFVLYHLHDLPHDMYL